MKQPLYNLESKKLKDIDLKKEIFDLAINHDLVYQVAVSLASNKRRPIAHTKIKSEVRGGGRKPWRQKGTGNARTGSIRNPIFRGGGIIFGPRNSRNFKKKINKKMKKKAFLSILSAKLKDNEIKIVNDFKLDRPDTKKMAGLFKKLKTFDKKTFVITKERNENLEKSLNNIKFSKYRLAGQICCLDLLNYKFVYFDQAAVQYYMDKYSQKEKNKEKKNIDQDKSRSKEQKKSRNQDNKLQDKAKKKNPKSIKKTK
ncbi:MAG: 50S ribosomal protein L4 [Candidatus Moranbacteria bacterium]|nr:50S ribosomal protein L4 [Candidatus Moranbacteria bacterium]